MPFITDAGLDNIGLESFAHVTTLSWIEYAAFGDGSSTLSEASTSLANELARTKDNGGFTYTQTYTVEGDFFVAEERVTYVFPISTNLNATQWGLVPDSSGGSFSVLDNFKQDPNDASSADITLNLQAGDELHIVVAEIVKLPRSVVDGSVDLAGTTYQTKTLFYSNGGNNIRFTFDAFSPRSGFSTTSSQLTLRNFGQADQANYNPDDEPSFIEYANGTRTLEPYTPGNYYRDKTIVVDTSALVGDLYGVAAVDNRGDGGLRLHFVDGPVPKTNAQRLTCVFRVSWARA